MVIIVYGTAGCGLCDAAKAKLTRLGLKYDSREIVDYLEHHTGWREDGSVDVRAAYDWSETLPVIKIDGWYGSYPEAMRRLRAAGRHAGQEGV